MSDSAIDSIISKLFSRPVVPVNKIVLSRDNRLVVIRDRHRISEFKEEEYYRIENTAYDEVIARLRINAVHLMFILMGSEVDHKEIRIPEERFERYMSSALQSYLSIKDLDFFDSPDRRYFVDEDCLLTFEQNVLMQYPVLQWVETDTEHVYMIATREPISGDEISSYVFFPRYDWDKHQILFYNGVRLEGDQKDLFAGLK